MMHIHCMILRSIFCVPCTTKEFPSITRCLACTVCVGKAVIDQVLKDEAALKDRTWRNVKDFSRNAITRESKNSSS